MNTKKMLSVAITVFCSLLINNSTAQQYQPLPESNASWLVQDRWSLGKQNLFFFLNTSFDDTVINSKEYIKIFEKALGIVADSSYVGAFRNNPIGKTFFIPSGGQQEFILQDYTKLKGDTVVNVALHNHSFIGSYDFVVDSVNYYPCGSHNLKFLSLHSIENIPNIQGGTSLKWIEEIGSASGGIFNQPEMGLNLYHLVCNSANDTIFYYSGLQGYWFSPAFLVYYQGGTCINYLSVDQPIIDTEFSIFPNPIESFITITSLKYFGDIQISVYNFIGQNVYNKLIPDFSYEFTINSLSHIQSGSYILIISNKQKQLWKQIITKM